MSRKEELSTVCIDKNLYRQELPSSTFEEARAIVLGKYIENEIQEDLEAKVRQHLKGCACCSQFLKDFEDDRVAVAICPSSELLDQYFFKRGELSPEQTKQIQEHLQECPLCYEELEWLGRVDHERIIELPAARKTWLQPVSIAAAICFMVLSAVLFWQKSHSQLPEEQLRALAVVHEPGQINFANLDQTSSPLPPDLAIQYEEAKTLLKQRKFENVAPRLEKIVDAEPHHSASVYLLGYCYYYLNQPEKAFALCDRAEQMHPHSLERCLSLVNIALKTGHFGRAVKEINGLYHEAPNVPQVRDLYQRISAITRGHTVKL
jgi:tetratricopeptide (TPR) repeat protein